MEDMRVNENVMMLGIGSREGLVGGGLLRDGLSGKVLLN